MPLIPSGRSGKRPLGFMYAWLKASRLPGYGMRQQKDGSDVPAKHVNFQPPFSDRELARVELSLTDESLPLFDHERELLPGESDEPEIIE